MAKILDGKPEDFDLGRPPAGDQARDVFTRLPRELRDKPISMRVDLIAAQGKTQSLVKTRGELNARAKAEKLVLDCMLTPLHLNAPDGRRGDGLSGDDQRVVEQKLRFAETVKSLEALEERIGRASEISGGIASLVGALERYVRRFPSDAFVDCAPPQTAQLVSKGETASDAIERRRRRIRELRADLEVVKAAPKPSAEVKKRMRAEISGLAARGTPDVFGMVEYGEQIRWPEVEPKKWAVIVKGEHVPMTPPAAFDALGAFVWLNEKAILAALEKEIDKAADDKSALTDEERKSRSAEILRDILANEREEEVLILLASENGLEISRRLDADPRAVLCLSSDMPPPEVFGIGAH
jgi:hypothetical protein